MARRKISQREARRAIRELEELRDEISRQRNNWLEEYPRGVYLIHFDNITDMAHGYLSAAARLDFPLAAKYFADQKRLRIYAVKP